MRAELDTLDAVTRVLARACRRLGEAGHPREAGRLTAEAWLVLRAAHPRQAQRLDGVMHHIARLEEAQEKKDRAGPLSRRPSAPTSEPIRKEAVVPTDERLLDVRTEIPKRRHELIFDTFVDLAPGAAYVLVNDHDPKPLKYQFEAEHAGEFSWDYLEEGPDVWRVRIGRTAAPSTASG